MELGVVFLLLYLVGFSVMALSLWYTVVRGMGGYADASQWIPLSFCAVLWPVVVAMMLVNLVEELYRTRNDMPPQELQ